MPTETPMKRATEVQAGSLRENIFLLHGMVDDSYGKLLALVQFVQDSHGQLQSLVKEMATIKASETHVASELTLIHAQAEANSTDLESLQQTVESSMAVSQDNNVKHNRILADMADILRDVYQAEDSIQEAIVSLTRQMHDHPCPWSQNCDTMTAADRMEAMDRIAALAPDFDMLTKRILDREGFVTGPDGPKPKYWAMQLLDKGKEAVVAVVVSSLATMAVGWFALKFVGALKPAGEQEIKQLQDQVRILQKDNNEKDAAVTALQMQLIDARKKTR